MSVQIRNQHASLAVPVYFTPQQGGMRACLHIDAIEPIVLEGQAEAYRLSTYNMVQKSTGQVYYNQMSSNQEQLAHKP